MIPTSSLAYGPPGYALRVLGALEDAGWEAWIVGGWVRDALRGAPSHDVDVTTSAPWPETECALSRAGIEVHETGTRHGTVTAVIAGHPVECTTYRVEGAYTDHRHPDQVRFVTDVRQDLARRDFTVNAIAYHPGRGLLDPFDGAGDLERGIIRCVGDADRRFEEDALRVLRAVRFACRLGFTIEPATQEALGRHARDLSQIAPERVGQEMDGIVASGRLSWALLEETPVMCAAIPELRSCAGFDQRTPYHAYDVLEHIARVCRGVEEFTGELASPELRWAAMLHDIAKPRCFTLDARGRGHFCGHPKEGARMAEDIMRRLALPRSLWSGARVLVRLHDHHVQATPRSVRRTLYKLEAACPGRAPELIYDLLDLKRADAVAKVPEAAAYAVELGKVERVVRRELARGGVLKVSDLAVGGADVMEALGVRPGPEVGRALEGLLMDVVNAEVENDRDALLARLRTDAASSSPSPRLPR